MTARTGLVIFTAFWVLTSIADGQVTYETTEVADTTVLPTPSRPVIPSLYAPTRIDLKPVTSFPVETEHYLYHVLRYVERNPLRANLVLQAEDWR